MLLRELRFLFLLLDQQSPLRSIEVTLPDRNFGAVFNFRALSLVDGDDFGKPPHTDGIESVILIERVKRRLVQPCQ